MNNSRPLASLSRRTTFSAARRLFHPDWSETHNREVFGRDTGPHGHDYEVEVAFSGAISASDGMITNLVDLKPILADAVAPLQNCWLERSIEEFDRVRPTAENVAFWLWNRLPAAVTCQAQLYRLRLRQSRQTRVEISALPSFSMKVSRSYEFAAAHRLFVPALSPAENAARFDKCANPAGHGHNYGLEVWIEGTPDAQTGFIINPLELDALVDEEVYARFDHKHLNEDCPEFRELVPTSENLALVIFERLDVRLAQRGFRLARIGLQETQKNYFEVEA